MWCAPQRARFRAPPGKASFRGNAGDARPEAERLKSDRIQNVIYYTYLLVIARKTVFFIDQEPTKVQTAPFSVQSVTEGRKARSGDA